MRCRNLEEEINSFAFSFSTNEFFQIYYPLLVLLLCIHKPSTLTEKDTAPGRWKMTLYSHYPLSNGKYLDYEGLLNTKAYQESFFTLEVIKTKPTIPKSGRKSHVCCCKSSVVVKLRNHWKKWAHMGSLRSSKLPVPINSLTAIKYAVNC